MSAAVVLPSRSPTSLVPGDPWLVGSLIALVVIGTVMVASASVEIAAELHNDPFFHVRRHIAYLCIGACALIFMFAVPTFIWERYGWVALLLAYVLLGLVLVPGIGREVNGSMRWIGLGPVNLQASELARLCVIVYMAGYLVRQRDCVRTQWFGLVKPMLVLALLVLLLLMEPDFGAAVVLVSSVLGMVFLSGARLMPFVALLLGTAGCVVGLAVSQPYRLARITTFADPWADPFNSGYQLTQSLIAFGRGEWVGIGLGNSIQKLFYLPEAHTDFVYAILAEETGVVGAVLVILLYAMLVTRGMKLGRSAERLGSRFRASLCYGIALCFAAQAFTNIGVNTGLLPTKGLTLPFLSFGGSSLVISLMAAGLLLRVELENRRASAGAVAGT